MKQAVRAADRGGDRRGREAGQARPQVLRGVHEIDAIAERAAAASSGVVRDGAAGGSDHEPARQHGVRCSLLERLQRRAAAGSRRSRSSFMMLVTVADVLCATCSTSRSAAPTISSRACCVVFVFHGMAAVFLGAAEHRHRRARSRSLVERTLSRVLIRLADVLSIACLLLLAWAMLTPALQAYALRRPQARARSADLDPVDRRVRRHGRHHPVRAGAILAACRRQPSTASARMSPPADRRLGVARPVRLLFLRVPVWIVAGAGRLLRQSSLLSGCGSAIRARRHRAVRHGVGLYAVGHPAVRADGRGRVRRRGCRATCSTPRASCCRACAAGLRSRRSSPRPASARCRGSSVANCRDHDPHGAAGNAQGRL